MDWLKDYDVVLLDFDGLLVDTEKVHFLAYETMLKNRGLDLGWSFEKYIKAAHHKAEGLQEEVTKQFPELKKIDWTVLYQEKRKELLNLYQKGEVDLMPGAESFLLQLEKAGVARAVVTHSDIHQIEMIKKALPVLNSVPLYITRYDYNLPKPNPESYQTAIKTLKAEGKKAIGFEDSPRGLKALIRASIHPVLVTEFTYSDELGIRKYKNLNEIQKQKNL